MVDGPLCRRWSICDYICNWRRSSLQSDQVFRIAQSSTSTSCRIIWIFFDRSYTIMMNAIRDKFLPECNGSLWRMTLLRKVCIYPSSVDQQAIHPFDIRWRVSKVFLRTRHRLLIKLRAHQTIYRKWLISGQHSWAQQQHFPCVHRHMPGSLYPLCHYLWRWRTRELQSRRHSGDTVRTCCHHRYRRQKQ